MKRLSWKYMAGLIDGEGCIDMQATTDKRDDQYYARPRLRISMVGEPGRYVIDLLKTNFGGSLEINDRGNPNWQTVYTWSLYGKQLRAYLQNIVTHLVIKKEQAKFAIWWTDNFLGKHVAIEVRRLATDELKAMKRDPQRLNEWAVRKLTDAIVQPA